MGPPFPLLLNSPRRLDLVPRSLPWEDVRSLSIVTPHLMPAALRVKGMYWKPPFLKGWEWGLPGLGVEGVTETLFSDAGQNVALVVGKCIMVSGGTG